MNRTRAPLTSQSAFERARQTPTMSVAERWATLNMREQQLMLRMVWTEARLKLRELFSLDAQELNALQDDIEVKTRTHSREQRLKFLAHAPLTKEQKIMICPFTTDVIETLSPQLKALAECYASGWTDTEIRRELSLSVLMFENQTKQLADALGVEDAYQISAMAFTHSLRKREKQSENTAAIGHP